MTAIEWTDTTWNPTTGCDQVSPGCGMARWVGDEPHGTCYALTMAKRLKGMGSAKYQNDGDPRTSGPGFGITEHPDVLNEPLRWRKPRRVFVNSMSDLFHDGVSDGFIARVWAVMAATPQHTYQVLTKRHGRLRSLLSSERFGDYVYEAWRRLRVEEGRPPGWGLDLPSRLPLPNVWLGVSVEDQKRADLRVPALLNTPAAVRFLSCEPLLGPVNLSRWLDTPLVCGCGIAPDGAPGWSGGCSTWCMTPEPSGLGWVIVGGESGSGARPMHPYWARQLRDQCVGAGVAFHFKQRGAWSWSRRDGDQWADDEPDAWVSEDDGTVVATSAEASGSGQWQGVHRVGKKAAGRDLDGCTWDEYPAAHAAAEGGDAAP